MCLSWVPRVKVPLCQGAQTRPGEGGAGHVILSARRNVWALSSSPPQSVLASCAAACIVGDWDFFLTASWKEAMSLSSAAQPSAQAPR